MAESNEERESGRGRAYRGSVMAEWRERERQRSSGGEREKMGEKNKVGPATVINWAHKKIESGFESGLDSKTGEGVNSNLPWDPHKIQVGISILI